MDGSAASRRQRRRRRWPIVAELCAVALLAAAACSGGSGGGPVTLVWYASNESGGPFQAIAERCASESGGAYEIKVELLPKDADQQRELLVRRLAAEDPSVDLMVMDVIWVPEFASARWVAPWPDDVARRVTDGRLPPAVRSATFQGRVWAAPLNGNAQLLWYRKDLVPTPPATWDELLTQSRALGPQGTIQTQGARYEGLTVLFNSLLTSAGGHLVSDDGSQVVLEEGPTKQALAVLRDFGTSAAAPPGLSTAKEDDARLGYEAGSSAFELNYGFIYASASKKKPELAAQTGWARWPGVVPGRPSTVTYGGFNLGVGAFTAHPKEAFAAATCIASDASQKQATLTSGLPPTAQALYDDPEIRHQLPFADELRTAMGEASVRPLTPAYNDISLAIQRTLHPIAGIDPDRDYPRLREAVERAITSKGLI